MGQDNNQQFQPDPKLFERLAFLQQTIECKRTDRVFTAPFVQYLPIHLYGETTVKDTMLNYENVMSSWIRYHQEYQPDAAWAPQAIFPGAALDVLGCNYIKWPGNQLKDPNAGFQVLDKEDGYMSADEYLEYAEDPTGFMIRKVLPRHYDALKGLEMLDFSNMVWQAGLYNMIPCAIPPVKAAFHALSEAGEKMMGVAQAGGKVMGTMAGMGWPSLCDQAATAPFDVFNDTLRGFLNTTMDMIEYPDELLAALNACTKIQVRAIKNTFKTQPFCKHMVFFLHNGFDMFMSREQFETFYWPGLKACVDAVLECGGVPHLYVEDKYDSKMDIIVRDLPAGKCIVTLINCNVEKWKAECQGKICLSGGVDGTLLQFGTPEQVIKNVKDTIDRWAPGGGYLLDVDTALDIAKPENLHALFDTAKSYMKY